MSNYDNNMKGVLFRAKERRTDKSPEYTGSVTINGKKWWLAAWVDESKAGEKYFSIKVSDPDERRDDKPVMDRGQQGRDERRDDDSEIPF